jgi:hypothetical protein
VSTKLNCIIEPLIDEMSEADARNLATLMLTRSTRFWTLFIQHLNETHFDLTQRIGLKIEEAWNFATNEAKRVMEDCNAARYSAHHAGGGLKDNHAFVAAKVLYALLKCHMVMEEFVQASFKNHPSIGSERVKLLFNNMSSGDSSSQSEAVAKAQASADKACTLVQSFQSRLDKAEKTLAKKADK